MSSQYGELWPTSSWDRSGSLEHTSQFQRLLHLGFVTAAVQRCRSTEANQTLRDVWPSPGLLHNCIYTFLELLLPDGNLPRANSLCFQVLHSPILVALLHGTPSAGVSQTLQRGTRNGITGLSQRAPPIFGWAAITLDIGPHCSFSFFSQIIFCAGCPGWECIALTTNSRCYNKK